MCFPSLTKIVRAAMQGLDSATVMSVVVEKLGLALGVTFTTPSRCRTVTASETRKANVAMVRALA
jgi:hypothetical protein